jgi:hypothetical protein
MNMHSYVSDLITATKHCSQLSERVKMEAKRMHKFKENNSIEQNSS